MRTTNGNRPLEFYLGKRYPFVIYPADEGGYVAEIEELPGCLTQGETLSEVEERIEDARKGWIEVAYKEGMEIPLPRTEETYSGKFVVRLPTYLHRRLAEQATREGISLNQYVLALLSKGQSLGEVISILKGIDEKVARLNPEAGSVARPTMVFAPSVVDELALGRTFAKMAVAL